MKAKIIIDKSHMEVRNVQKYEISSKKVDYSTEIVTFSIFIGLALLDTTIPYPNNNRFFYINSN